MSDRTPCWEQVDRVLPYDNIAHVDHRIGIGTGPHALDEIEAQAQ